jgi:SWIM zinc finger
VSSDTFLVPSCSKHGGEYLVDLEAGTCECEDHKRYGGPCKHAFGAMLYRAWIRRAARTIAPVLASGTGGDEDL